MRTTKAKLESQVEQINMLTNSPLTPYETTTCKARKCLTHRLRRDENGNLISRAGHYYISYAYGRSRLERVCNTGGGCSDISHSVTKGELNSILHGIINVLENLEGKIII